MSAAKKVFLFIAFSFLAVEGWQRFEDYAKENHFMKRVERRIQEQNK